MKAYLNQYLAIRLVFLVGVFLIKAHFHFLIHCVIIKGGFTMTVKDVVGVSCTNFKIYVGNQLIYSPFDKGLEPLLDEPVAWLDARDDVLVIGINASEGWWGA